MPKLKKIIFALSLIFSSLIYFSCNQRDNALAKAGISDVPQVSADTENVAQAKEDIKETKVYYEWKKSSPASSGVSEAKLQRVLDAIKDTEITSNIIVKDGSIISEYFKEGYSNTSLFSVQSCSKSITSAIIGCAIENKDIPNIDVPIANYFERVSDSNDARLKQITLRHLLTNTSGLISTDTEIWTEWRNSENWIDYLFDNPLKHTPGAVFDYSTGNTHIASAILQKATGKTLYEYGKEHIFDKIGMRDIRCAQDRQGISDGGNGFSLTAYDMALFGQLYLNKGEWNGEQIIPSSWVSESTRVQLKDASYGYQWWIRYFGSKGYRSYFAHGWGEQVIAVIPGANMVVTFTSRYPDNRRNKIYWQYITDIVDAIN